MKLKVPATQRHHRERAAPARWLAVSQVRFLYGLPTYNLVCNMYSGVRKQQHSFFLLFNTVIDKHSKLDYIFIFIGKLDDYLDCTSLSLGSW